MAVVRTKQLAKPHSQRSADFKEGSRGMEPAVVVQMLPSTGRNLGLWRAVTEKMRFDQFHSHSHLPIHDRQPIRHRRSGDEVRPIEESQGMSEVIHDDWP